VHVQRLASDIDSKFAIRIVISAEDISLYALDPTRTKLVVSDEGPAAPAKVYPRLQTSDNVWKTSDHEIKTPTRLSKTNRWFELRFNITPPKPDQEFTLLIDGLTRTDVPFPIPQIVFKKSMRYKGGSFI
jgi:hypothetical protein